MSEVPGAHQIFTENVIREGNLLRIMPTPELTHTFISEGFIDLSPLPQGKIFKVPLIHTDDLSGFASAAGSLMKTDRVVTALEQATDPKIRNYLLEIIENKVIRPASKDSIKESYLYHAGCSLFMDKEGHVKDKIASMKNGGVYGADKRVSYFSVNQYASLIHGLGNYNQITDKGNRYPNARILFLTIDARKLLEKRNIFIDPESLLPEFWQEFGKNFTVHAGFPISSIFKAEILRYEGYHLKPQ